MRTKLVLYCSKCALNLYYIALNAYRTIIILNYIRTKQLLNCTKYAINYYYIALNEH